MKDSEFVSQLAWQAPRRAPEPRCVALASINEALGHAYATWKRDTSDFRRVAVNTTDEAFFS